MGLRMNLHKFMRRVTWTNHIGRLNILEETGNKDAEHIHSR